MAKNNFIILETIREGHSTRVLKAEQPSLGRTVLLKALHRHLVGDARLVKRFEREARACAMIRSEHIVQVYDLTELDGAPAIVMEYVEGKSLEELLQEGKQPEEFARMVAAGVLKALSVAHRAGVIHRDIKPANILIDRHGMVKVTDFGLASIGAATTLTAEGTVVGTPAYMSPEQVSGGTLDGRTDLFSLGVTLIELITGEKLFHGETYAECFNKILNYKSSSIDHFAEDLSAPFLNVVRRLMMPRREDRYASADEALRNLTGEEIRPKGRSSPSRRRFRNRLTMGFAAVLVFVVLFIIRPWATKQPGNELKEQPTSTQGDSLKLDRTSVLVPSVPSRQGSVTQDSQRTKTGKVFSRKTRQESETQALKPVSSEESASGRAVVDSGYVEIACTPWAKVFIGGEYVGTTPIAGALKVRAGTHTITFNNPSFLPLVKTVTVQPATETRVEANFLETVGYLLVVCHPWAEIYVDDQYRETTPLGQPLMLSSGNRKVRLHNPSFEDIVTTVTIGVRDTFRLVKSFSVK